jgi:hypothetical protein
MKLKCRMWWCHGYRVKWHCYAVRQSLSSRWLMIGARKVQIKINVEWPLWLTRLIAKPGQHDFSVGSFRGDPAHPSGEMAFMTCRFCKKVYGQTGGQLWLTFEHFDSDYPCEGMST